MEWSATRLYRQEIDLKEGMFEKVTLGNTVEDQFTVKYSLSLDTIFDSYRLLWRFV